MNGRVNLDMAVVKSPILAAVAAFAVAAHASIKQVRKYTGAPYFTHPLDVAEAVAGVPGATPEMIAAALLHDVLEDTGITADLIGAMFGYEVKTYVLGLTDRFTPERHPGMNRAERKQAEAVRYGYEPYEVATVKLGDVTDNTKSIGEHDEKFLKVYGPEKRFLLGHLRHGDAGLWLKADDALSRLGY